MSGRVAAGAGGEGGPGHWGRGLRLEFEWPIFAVSKLLLISTNDTEVQTLKKKVENKEKFQRKCLTQFNPCTLILPD